MLNHVIVTACLVLCKARVKINLIKCIVHGIQEDFWSVYSCKEMGHVLVHRQEIVEHLFVVTVALQSMLIEINSVTLPLIVS